MHKNDQLKSLTTHLQNIREEERTKMAREIHDELGQQLTALKMDIDWIKHKQNNSEAPVVTKLQAAGIKVIVCTPAVIGERIDHSNAQDGDLNFYSNWIREFSHKNSLPLVDLRQGFIQYNLKNNRDNKESGILTTDRVHLTPAGNKFVAEEMWKVIKTVK